MSSRRCSGAIHVSGQPVLPHRTTMWPPRAFWAAGQSHGSQLIVTRAGPHGWWDRQYSGMSGILTRSTSIFKHVVERVVTLAAEL